VALSRAPFPTGQGGAALLRLSWSGRPERIERCRELTDRELEELPAHMRRRLECEGHSARYTVSVRSDGRLLSVDTVAGGGLRGDRAIHMLREYRLAPGEHAIAVEIVRTGPLTETRDAEAEEDGEQEAAEPGPAPLDRRLREREERRRQRQEALPPRLLLDTRLRLSPGGVALVTYEPTGRRLVVLTDSRP